MTLRLRDERWRPVEGLATLFEVKPIAYYGYERASLLIDERVSLYIELASGFYEQHVSAHQTVQALQDRLHLELRGKGYYPDNKETFLVEWCRRPRSPVGCPGCGGIGELEGGRGQPPRVDCPECASRVERWYIQWYDNVVQLCPRALVRNDEQMSRW